MFDFTLVAEKSINAIQRRELQQKINELNTSNMTGNSIHASTNNTSFSSIKEVNLDTKNNTIDLCQTCQSSIGEVGEAAEKIKALAIGNIHDRNVSASKYFTKRFFFHNN